MDIADLFYRLAELSDESILAELIKGNRVFAQNQWFTIGERKGKIVLLDSKGVDYSFSDLSVITDVDWCPEVSDVKASKPVESKPVESKPVESKPVESTVISAAALATAKPK